MPGAGERLHLAGPPHAGIVFPFLSLDKDERQLNSPKPFSQHLPGIVQPRGLMAAREP